MATKTDTATPVDEVTAKDAEAEEKVVVGTRVRASSSMSPTPIARGVQTGGTILTVTVKVTRRDVSTAVVETDGARAETVPSIRSTTSSVVAIVAGTATHKESVPDSVMSA